MAWDPSTSASGSELTDQLIPLAERLVAAVHHDKQLGVDTAFVDAEEIAGGPVKAAQALAILLAGMCPDYERATELLSWRRNPVEYHRLRRAGVTADAARQLSARLNDRLRRGNDFPSSAGDAA